MVAQSPQGPPPTPAQLEAIMNGPALAPPKGVRPNFVDPWSLEDVFIATATITFTISTFLVMARMYTKAVLMKKFGSEDWLCLLCYVLWCIIQGAASQFTIRGGGRHQWNVQAKNMLEVGYWVNVASINFVLAFMFIKLSILTSYRKIFVPVNKRAFMFWGTWGAQAVIVVFYTVSLFFTIFVCNPRAKVWNPSLPGTCMSIGGTYVGVGIGNVVTDLFLLFMPQHAIWNLHLPMRKRLAVSSMFLVGIFGTISSCMRLYYSFRLSSSPDVSYEGMNFGLWTYAELCSGFMVACLPVMPRFLQKTIGGSQFYKRFLATVRPSKYSGGSNSGKYKVNASNGYYKNMSSARRTSDAERGLKSKDTTSEVEMDDRSITPPQHARTQSGGIRVDHTIDVRTHQLHAPQNSFDDGREERVGRW